MKFCTGCGQPLAEDVKFCSNCGADRAPVIPAQNQVNAYSAAMIAAMLDDVSLMARMNDSQKMIFLSQKKDSTTGLLLCLFLGGIGAHQFYLGNVGLGIVYALFFWTCIPAIVAFVEMFTIKQRVNVYNRNLALRIGIQMASY